MKLNTQKITLKNKKTVAVGIVMDESGSMLSLRSAAIKSLEQQVKDLAKQVTENPDITTYLSLATFAYGTKVHFQGEQVKENTTADASDYNPAGGTALNDAIMDMNTMLNQKFADSYLMVIITDGEENSSRRNNDMIVRNMIKNNLATDKWTFAFAVPPGSAVRITNLYGVPRDCVTEWEATEIGIEKLTQYAGIGTQTYYGNVTRGVMNTSNYFQPDLSNLNKTVLKTQLNDVTKNFFSLTVPAGKVKLQISKFIQDQGHTYYSGKCYYQLTKVEKVQAFKDILVMENSTGKIYTDEDVRSVLGLPSGGTIELNPAFHPKYTIFVKSMSWNRHLVPGTTLLCNKV